MFHFGIKFRDKIQDCFSIAVPRLGIEPRLTEPESAVLPLDDLGKI